MKRIKIHHLAIVVLCNFSLGCSKESNAEHSTAVHVAPTTTPVAAPTKTAPTKKQTVAQIVFFGKKGACDCTRERIETSWQVLTKVLGKRKVPVKRYQIDVHEAEAKRYHAIRPYMVIPAIYFFDANEKLIDLLQGEITELQLFNLPW